MSIHHLLRRIEQLREQARQLPRKGPDRDLADLGAVFVGQERLDWLAFIATVRDRFPGGVWSDESLDAAFPLLTKEEKAEFRCWLVLAEERESKLIVG